MAEKTALMCRPISAEGYVVPGTLPDKCSNCGQSVCVSPSSWLIMHDNPEMEILCLPCAIAEMKKDEQLKINGLTPAQTEEIEAYLDSR